jgi:hypothetical protein
MEEQWVEQQHLPVAPGCCSSQVEEVGMIEGCTVSYFYDLLGFFERRKRATAGSTTPPSSKL